MFENVADELCAELERGEIYSLKEVCDRYCALLSDFDIDPGVYRGQHFKAKSDKLLPG